IPVFISDWIFSCSLGWIFGLLNHFLFFFRKYQLRFGWTSLNYWFFLKETKYLFFFLPASLDWTSWIGSVPAPSWIGLLGFDRADSLLGFLGLDWIESGFSLDILRFHFELQLGFWKFFLLFDYLFVGLIRTSALTSIWNFYL
ncbi:hypothetical protein RhiirA1_399215, partial [Rhizophagus irregularis]